MKRVYFDNGATSYPKPKEVIEAVTDYMTNIGCNIGRGVYKDAETAENIIYDTREAFATLFNMEQSENVCFTKNITESINIIIKGFIKKGDKVIVSTVEHNAVMRPLNFVGAEVVKVDLISDEEQGLLDLDSKLNQEIKAVIMTHSSNVTGDILPISKVGELCKKHKVPFILDSAQSAGVLSIDMKQMNIDCVCFTGHKSLLGPQGIGGFAISPEFEKKISSFVQGGTGSSSDLEIQPEFMPDKFESGTQNLPGIFGLKAGLDFINQIGIDNIHNRELELCKYFYEKLLEIDSFKDKVKIIAKKDIIFRTPIISLDFLGKDNAVVSHELQSKYNIQNRCGLQCSPSAHKFYDTFPQGTVRFSLGYFNTYEEIGYVCNAISEILKIN